MVCISSSCNEYVVTVLETLLRSTQDEKLSGSLDYQNVEGSWGEGNAHRQESSEEKQIRYESRTHIFG